MEGISVAVGPVPVPVPVKLMVCVEVAGFPSKRLVLVLKGLSVTGEKVTSSAQNAAGFNGIGTDVVA
jgi:hypothetical protein